MKFARLLKRQIRTNFTLTPLYTATATSTGGRSGTVSTQDKVINLALSLPKGLGGPESISTSNPEQLFAAGYSSCFMGAVGAVARTLKVKIPDNASVKALVSIGKTEGYSI
jgi:osmotically inducible protein OsmC